MLATTADFPNFPIVDVAALHETAAGLRRLVAGLDDAAATVRAVASSVYGPVWHGSAADAWAEQASAVYADLQRGGPLLTEAAGAADRLADEVSDAHAAYTRARSDYDTAVTSRDTAAAAASAGAVHATAAVTAAGQTMSDAAAGGGRAAGVATAAGDAAASVFTACANVADNVGSLPSAGPSSAHLTPAWTQTGVSSGWVMPLLGRGVVTLVGFGGSGDDAGEIVYIDPHGPGYGYWEGPDDAYGHGANFSSESDDPDALLSEGKPPRQSDSAATAPGPEVQASSAQIAKNHQALDEKSPDVGHSARHQYPGVRARKSQFFDGDHLAALSDTTAGPGTVQANGNTRYVLRAEHVVGIDRTTGQPTEIYTVIRGKDGSVVTMFPGTSPKS